MTNAFVAALLKTAAEERLRAETERNLLYPEPLRSSWQSSYNRFGEERIKEYEGRAEVYERFATRIIGEIAGDLMLAEFANLTGPAELLEIDRPFEFHFDHGSWLRSYWDWGSWTIGRIADPQSLIILPTN